MGNQALMINSAASLTTINLTTNGSNWLYSVFSLMSLSAIIIALLSMRIRSQERSLYLSSISILTTASIAYFCMASGLGLAPVEVLQNGPGTRQFWYVRYIDWVVTTPLLLAELLSIAGLPLNIILSSIFADIVMIICGLIGGLVQSVFKWAFFVFGCVAMFWVFWNIFTGIKSSEKLGGKKLRRTYIILTIWLVFFWSLYPVAWGLCEGSNIISVTGEMIFYGILDILTKPIFAGLVLFLHQKNDEKRKPPALETNIQVERVNYPQNLPYDTERINTGYRMNSSEIIRTYY